jgi:hypothetical protein
LKRKAKYSGEKAARRHLLEAADCDAAGGIVCQIIEACTRRAFAGLTAIQFSLRKLILWPRTLPSHFGSIPMTSRTSTSTGPIQYANTDTISRLVAIIVALLE